MYNLNPDWLIVDSVLINTFIFIGRKYPNYEQSQFTCLCIINTKTHWATVMQMSADLSKVPERRSRIISISIQYTLNAVRNVSACILNRSNMRLFSVRVMCSTKQRVARDDCRRWGFNSIWYDATPTLAYIETTRILTPHKNPKQHGRTNPTRR